MASTYDPLFSTTLGTSAASVTFNSIPQGYTDLVLEIVPIAATAANGVWTVNGDTSGNYSNTTMYGDGGSPFSGRGTNQTSGGFQYTGSSLNTVVALHFMSYANTNVYKTVLHRGSNAAAAAQATVYLWRSTAAITTIVLSLAGSVNFSAGSTFRIYGVKAA